MPRKKFSLFWVFLLLTGIVAAVILQRLSLSPMTIIVSVGAIMFLGITVALICTVLRQENRYRAPHYKDRDERSLLSALGITVTLSALFLLVTLGLFHIRYSFSSYVDDTSALNLNDGQSIFPETDGFIQPGTTVEKTFFIENNGMQLLSYRLYMTDVQGALAEELMITISCADTILFSGTDATQVVTTTDFLTPGQRKELTITLSLDENSGNTAETESLYFTLRAEAIQALPYLYNLYGKGANP